ncbi:MAG: 2,3-bisphosphoglycerate-dependent phosphoglycerate mutase [Cryomorphaceae bacterium]
MPNTFRLKKYHQNTLNFMKHILLSLLLIIPSLGFAGDATTFYLIRHTEKDLTIKNDPPLTQIGQYRAKKWAEVFSHIKVDAVYSTDTLRTRDTAKPTAVAQNKEVVLYSHRDFDFEGLINKHQGETVVIVGHSNTTPNFANGLLGEDKYEEMDESQYSRLYQVVITGEARHGQILLINPLSE